MARVSSHKDTWCQYSLWTDQAKRGLEQCWSSEPGTLLLSRKDCGLHLHLTNVDGEDQPAASQMSDMDTPLDHAQEEAMSLVESALIPREHRDVMEDYANVIASTNRLEILCFITGPPLAQLPKPTKSCSDFLHKAESSI